MINRKSAEVPKKKTYLYHKSRVNRLLDKIESTKQKHQRKVDRSRSVTALDTFYVFVLVLLLLSFDVVVVVVVVLVAIINVADIIYCTP